MESNVELKKIRKEKRLSLEKVSRDIKIPVSKLKALEEGNYDCFSGKFYAKSFLKMYADYLDVPLYENINEEENEKKEPVIISERILMKPQKPHKRSRRIFPVSLVIMFIAVLLLTGVLYLAENNFMKFETKQIISEKEVVLKPVETVIMVKGVTITPTWVRVIVDGKLKHETVLKKGTITYWQADKTMKIKIGYVKGIDIYYRAHAEENYEKIDIYEGSVGDVNEIEFVNEFSE